MKMKRKILTFLLIAIMSVSMLAGCGQDGNTDNSEDTNNENSADAGQEEETARPESYDVLEGITFSVIGDSYLAGKGLDDKSSVWPALLATKYNMVYKNYGVNGSTISNYAGENYNPMVDRYDEIANNNPDIIIVEGGRNDYNQDVPMGEDGSLDTKTMKGAVRFLITKLQEKFPNALIIGVTCWEVGGLPNEQGYTCSDYGRALIDVCKELGVPYINAMDSDAMGVYMTDATFRRQYCISFDDISHLNKEGMKLVLPAFETQIAEFYEQFLNQNESE